MTDSLDRWLVVNSGAMTPAELGQATGLSEAEVVERIQSFVDKRLSTSDLEFARQLIQLETLAAEGLQRAANASDRDSSAHITAAKNSVQAVQKLRADFDKRQAENALEADQRAARVLVRIVERAFDRTLGALVERFGGVDREEVEGAFRKNLMEVSAEYQREE